ncbi:hypothetical protein ACHQM5_007385 [Ranunculus cassubicifolius]
MDYSVNKISSVAIILFLIMVGVMYISTSTTDVSNRFLALKTYYQCLPSANETYTPMVSSQDELETALTEASMPNKTLIIAILNKAYIEGEKAMLDLFLESFWMGKDTQFLINHLLLVAMDQTAFDRCKFLRLHCYRLVTEGVDFGGEKLYMSQDFINMMWRRTSFLHDVLQRGYSFIFTDTDILWLGNPFRSLSQDENEDIQISVDKFKGEPWSANNSINTGFYFIRSNNKTITLFQTWYANRLNSNYTGMKEQDVLEKMIHNGILTELGLKVRFLQTIYFSGFCENSSSFNAVATVHANCCRSINAKVADLIVVLRDWRRFRAFVEDRSRNLTTSSVVRWSKHTACENSWKNLNTTQSLKN